MPVIAGRFGSHYGTLIQVVMLGILIATFTGMQTQTSRIALTVHAVLVASLANALALATHAAHIGVHVILPLVHLSAEVFGFAAHYETQSKIAAAIELAVLVIGLVVRHAGEGVQS